MIVTYLDSGQTSLPRALAVPYTLSTVTQLIRVQNTRMAHLMNDRIQEMNRRETMRPSSDTDAAELDPGAARRDRKRLRGESLILDAATAVFMSKGMSTTTMQDIAQAADIAQGTLYNYFPNKETLTIAVVRRMIKAYGLQLLEEETVKGDINPLDMIALSNILLIRKGTTDPFWQVLVERYDVFSDALHDELEEVAMKNMRNARKLGFISGTDEILSIYWKTGAWVISGAVRDIAMKRFKLDHMFTIATLTLMKMGIPSAQAKAVVKRLRTRTEAVARADSPAIDRGAKVLV